MFDEASSSGHNHDHHHSHSGHDNHEGHAHAAGYMDAYGLGQTWGQWSVFISSILVNCQMELRHYTTDNRKSFFCSWNKFLILFFCSFYSSWIGFCLLLHWNWTTLLSVWINIWLFLSLTEEKEIAPIVEWVIAYIRILRLHLYRNSFLGIIKY